MFPPVQAAAITTLRVGLLLLALARFSAAAAQEPVDEPTREARYDQYIKAALDDHEHQRYIEAKANFEAAHALLPSARTLRGLGKVEFELRNYGAALTYLSEALTSEVRPLSSPLREEVEDLIRRCQLYVGQLHLEVQPDTATVLVDGVKVAGGPHTSLSLVVGDHVLELRALGRMPERRNVTIHGGQAMKLQIILNPAAPPAERQAIPEEPVRRDARRKKAWLWGTLGVVAVAVTVGVSVALARDRTETKSSPPTGPDGEPTAGPIIEALKLP